jgi:serine/threonine protein phosphatase PrpC
MQNLLLHSALNINHVSVQYQLRSDSPNTAVLRTVLCMSVGQFCGDPNSLFAGVFDGHGSYGDLCSQFAADYLPRTFAQLAGKTAATASSTLSANTDSNSNSSDKQLSPEAAHWAALGEVEVAAAAAAAHVRVNEDMHAANFDDTLSGTTAISVLLKVSRY